MTRHPKRPPSDRWWPLLVAALVALIWLYAEFKR